MSENLTRAASKIDFSKTNDLEIKKEVEGDLKTLEEEKNENQKNNLWPWDSVRNKLRNSLTEVCVLADVLAIAKEKKYLVLDPVQQEQQETKPMVQVYARKKALAGAASVLLTGILPIFRLN